MWKRIVWDICALTIVFFAPWWASLVFAIIASILFSWYWEMLFIGILYDVMFGGVTGSWYYHSIHTIIFILPLLGIEFIKTRINTR